MAQRLAIGLDDPIFSGRLKTYQKRPVEAVKPRGGVTYLRKVVGVDVWLAPEKPKTSKFTEPIFLDKVVEQKQTIVPVLSSPEAIKPPKQKQVNYITQNFQTNTDTHISRQKTRRHLGLNIKRIPNLVFVIMAIVLFIFGTGVALQSFLLNRKFTNGHVVAQSNNGTPDTDESKPSQKDMASYSVAPDKPRYLRIAKLDVFARVRQLGVNEKNQLKSPYNINDAGWYKDSAVPGSGVGASIIDGHVSGPTQPGVFYNLTHIAIGDEITIERGDGKILTYRVIESKSYPADKLDMSKLLEPKNPAKPGLNLITCTGKINPGTDDYQDRLVVFTEQI